MKTTNYGGVPSSLSAKLELIYNKNKNVYSAIEEFKERKQDEKIHEELKKRI